MRIRKLLLMSAALLFVASTARADWFVSPMVGGNFGGDTPSVDRNHRPPFGVSLGYMGGGILGYETSIFYTPSFFGNSDLIGSNNVLSWMGNLIVGVPIGDETQIRPYVSGGAGLLRSRIGGGANDLFNLSSNDFGVDIGGGAMGFFTPHVGLRGDIRYFRSLSGTALSNPASISNAGQVLGHFNFWEATAGVAFKF
jgi:hypothetical protein